MLRISQLPREERLLLLKFVCSFAWADFEVGPGERAFVTKLIQRARLHADEAHLVRGWLESPPDSDEIDPTHIPHEHRQLFVDAVREVLRADHDITPEEREMLGVFEELVR
jgi:hypothetical protein